MIKNGYKGYTTIITIDKILENPCNAVAKENALSCISEKYKKGKNEIQAMKSKYIHLNRCFMNTQISVM